MVPLNKEDELRTAWRSLAALGRSDGWQVIPVGAAKRTLAGIRFPAREESLLVGFNVGPIRASDLPQGQGFSVERLGESVPAGFADWISVSRKPSASLDLFALMAADLLDTASGPAAEQTSGELPLFYRFLARIRSWQRFMSRPATQRLTDDEEVGLFGELTFLTLLLDSGHPEEAAIDFWKGPMNSLRDYTGETLDVEVKSTVAVNGFPAKIGSLEQLDDADGHQLYLVALRFALQEEGTRLPGMIEAIRSKLPPSVVPRFERRLTHTGYTDSSSELYVRTFALADERVFAITGDFPRLARSSVALPIREAEYVLDLDLIQTPAGSVKDLALLISGH